MTQAEILKQVIKNYRFDRPLPQATRREAVKAERSTLVVILKKQGRYSPFIFLVIAIFFLAKRFGLILTMAKSAAIAGAVSIAAAGLVTGSAIYTAGRIIDQQRVIEQQEEISPIEKDANTAAPVKKRHTRTTAPVLHEIGLMPLQALDIGQETERLINRGLLRALRRAAGKDRVGPYDKATMSHRPSKLIIGSAVPGGKGYVITVKIINTETSRVLYIGSGEIGSDEEIDRVCGEIAAAMAGKLQAETFTGTGTPPHSD